MDEPVNNTEAFALLDKCLDDLNIVKATLIGLVGSPAAPYLRKYCVIRASGGIEVAYKKIIADKVDQGSHEQVKTFIKKRVRETSKNPRLEAIESTLQEFDGRWARRFKELVALDNPTRLRTALAELVKARNSFAHGGESEMAIDRIIEYFNDGVRAISLLDKAVHHQYDEPIEECPADETEEVNGSTG